MPVTLDDVRTGILLQISRIGSEADEDDDGMPTADARKQMADLRKMLDDPKELQSIADEMNADEKRPVSESLERGLLESGFSGVITDSAGHKRQYVNGKPVAMRHDDDQHPPMQPHEERELAGKLSDGAKDPKTGGIREAVKAKIHAVRAAAFNAATKVAGAVGNLATEAVLPTADEFIRSTLSKPHDPAMQAMGVGFQDVATIASTALSHAIVYLKKKMAKRESEEGKPTNEEIAGHVRDVIAAIYESIGAELDPPSIEEIVAHLEAKAKG